MNGTTRERRRGRSKEGRTRPAWQTAALHAVLVVLGALFLVPLFWLIGSSLKTDDQIKAFPPEWLPDLPFYWPGSPYVDQHEVERALRQATDADSRQSALASAWRALMVGEVTFQGEMEGAGAPALDRLRWHSRTGSMSAGPAIQLDGQEGVLVGYGQSRVTGQIKQLAVATAMYRREDGAVVPVGAAPAPARKGAYGSIEAGFGWRPELARFSNVTVRLHGDRSWRHVRIRLATPEGAYRTPKPILLSFANWTDVILIRQAKGSMPWGTYRLVTDPSGQPTTSGRAALELEVLSADRPQVILRKLLNNYPSGLTFIPFARYLLNTLLICGLVVLGTILSCSLVAYGLTRIRWRGRNALFYLIVGTMMLPFQVTMVPMFVVFAKVGWVDTFLPLIVPAFFGNAFFIFLLRQFFLTIPPELTDAARIDGCSELDIYRRVVLPLAKPALATVGLFAFMNTWNDYIGPLIYLSDASRYTLSLGLATFSSQYGSYPGMLMAVTTVMTIPIIILFFLAQRTFIQGITLTGIKG